MADVVRGVFPEPGTLSVWPKQIRDGRVAESVEHAAGLPPGELHPVVSGDPQVASGGPGIVIGAKVYEGPAVALPFLDHSHDAVSCVFARGILKTICQNDAELLGVMRNVPASSGQCLTKGVVRVCVPRPSHGSIPEDPASWQLKFRKSLSRPQFPRFGNHNLP